MNPQAEWIRQQNEQKAQQEASAVQARQLQSLETTVLTSFKALLRYLDDRTTKTEVVNQLKEIGTPDALKVVEAVNGLNETLKNKETDLSEVTTILRDVLAQISEIPKEHPEAPEQREDVKITNFDELSKNFDRLEFAVNALAEKELPTPQVNVKAPNVKVDAPIVNVEPVDFATLVKPLKEVVTAVKNIAIPAQIKTDTSKIEKKLDKSNELLEKISTRPSGGGGGGSGTSFKDSTGTLQYVELVGGAVPVTDSAVVAAIEGITIPAPEGGATEDYQEIQADVLNEIRSAIQAIAQAKGIAADLRVTLLGGTTAVTTVTTVTTVGGLTNIGGLPATQIVPATTNTTAVLSNINNVV